METKAYLSPEGYLMPIDDLPLESGEVYLVKVTKIQKKRTPTQNRSLHKYCTLLADDLNNAGFYQNVMLDHSFNLPWSMETVKANLWKPIQSAVVDKESTADANTGDYSRVYDVLSSNLAMKLGITTGWPDRGNNGKS